MKKNHEPKFGKLVHDENCVMIISKVKVVSSLVVGSNTKVCWLGVVISPGGKIVISLAGASVHLDLDATDRSWGGIPSRVLP
jgi:hypothetical protein